MLRLGLWSRKKCLAFSLNCCTVHFKGSSTEPLKEDRMSKRHRSQEAVPLPRAEQRAHAHGERHRVHSELHELAELVSHGVEPDDVVEPGAEWKPLHHHDAEKAVKKLDRNRNLRHWKVKEWKRRTTVRRQKAAAYRDLAQSA